MCGRYTLHHNTQQVALHFTAEEIATELTPRYNIAPTQPVAVVTVNSPRRLDAYRWGLIPSWAKDPAIGNKLINARAETLAEKPAFKNALTRRRCLILADGFFEWRTIGGAKQPMYIRRRDGELFAFAGLWEEWRPPDGEPVRTCTIITVEPNSLMAPIHSRMPAILRPEDEAAWLDVSIKSVPAILAMLKPYPAEEMEVYAVERRVNSPAVDEPGCIEPIVRTT